jgi:hypothetical protein
MAGAEQLRAEQRPDVTGTAGDEDTNLMLAGP